MIEVYRAKPYNRENLLKTLENIKPSLIPDFSNYAKNRPRVWLGIEPSLNSSGKEKPGYPISSQTKQRLAEIIDWEWDFCLLIFSGPEAIGISPHRDASYADYEGRGFNITGTAEFHYWNDRKSFGKSPSTGVKMTDPPTDIIQLGPDDCIKFNVKNPHAAIPAPNRWSMNFWRRKP